jgi:uncharacterized membrane protein YphA (DoxX/SURF4 family)
MALSPRRVLEWVVSGLLFLLFILAAVGKLTHSRGQIELFRRFGYPDGLYYIVGLMEVAGALLLLVPRTAPIGASLLALVMLGATGTHLWHQEFGRAAYATVLLLALVWLALRRRAVSLAGSA